MRLVLTYKVADCSTVLQSSFAVPGEALGLVLRLLFSLGGSLCDLVLPVRDLVALLRDLLVELPDLLLDSLSALGVSVLISNSEEVFLKCTVSLEALNVRVQGGDFTLEVANAVLETLDLFGRLDRLVPKRLEGGRDTVHRLLSPEPDVKSAAPH